MVHFMGNLFFFVFLLFHFVIRCHLQETPCRTRLKFASVTWSLESIWPSMKMGISPSQMGPEIPALCFKCTQWRPWRARKTCRLALMCIWSMSFRVNGFEPSKVSAQSKTKWNDLFLFVLAMRWVFLGTRRNHFSRNCEEDDTNRMNQNFVAIYVNQVEISCNFCKISLNKFCPIF